MSIGFYLCDFLFRKILRHNADVRWAIHFTSVIHGAANIKRGKGVYPGDSPNVFINADNGIEIGDYTNIGPGVALVSANHDFIQNELNVSAPPINIGKHCWLGHAASVMPGIILGERVFSHSRQELSLIISIKPLLFSMAFESFS